MEAAEFMGMKKWVVAGDVLNKEKYAFKIVKALEDEGYDVEGVNPKETSEEVFKSLKEVDSEIDVLDLCINPRRGLEIAKEALAIGVKNILIQPGAESDEILEFCKKNGINAVKGCVLKELKRN